MVNLREMKVVTLQSQRNKLQSDADGFFFKLRRAEQNEILRSIHGKDSRRVAIVRYERQWTSMLVSRPVKKVLT